MSKGGRLTTHVLDIAQGRPAAGLYIVLYGDEGGQMFPLGEAVTNGDGRCEGPLLEGDAFRAGAYELRFDAGAYFEAQKLGAGFLGIVPVRFNVLDAAAHYHVPLLLTPFSYSTYRGS